MTIVEYTTQGGGLISLDRRINRRYFWVARSSVGKKRLLYRRNELKNLPSLSSISQAADAWNLLSSGDKSAWEEAAVECGLTAYNLFIQDKIYRIINSIGGNATPNEYHQYKAGHIGLPVSIGHFYLRQVGITIFDFPAILHIHAKTALTDENSPNGYFKIRFSYNYNEGGGELTETKELTLSLNADWTNYNTGIVEHTGQTGSWVLDIEGNYLNGNCWFDDLYITTLSGIINKDPYCVKPDLYFFRLLAPVGILVESSYPAD